MIFLELYFLCVLQIKIISIISSLMYLSLFFLIYIYLQ